MRNAKLWQALAVAVLTVAVPARAQDSYKPGDTVEVFSPMAQAWIKGKIVSVDGKAANGQTRYMFRADDHSLANDYWGTTAESIRPVGGQDGQQQAQGRNTAPAPAPAGQNDVPTTPPPQG